LLPASRFSARIIFRRAAEVGDNFHSSPKRRIFSRAVEDDPRGGEADRR